MSGIELVDDSFNYENIAETRKKLPEQVIEGPVKKRRCTDWYFCLLTFGAIFGVIYLIRHAQYGSEEAY